MSEAAQVDFDPQRVELRLASKGHYPAIRELFRASLLEGQLADNDTGADIDDIKAGYFSHGGDSAFWVAIHDSQVIGMIGVQKTGEHVAEVRRIRVREGYRRRGIGTALTERALSFCRERGYLKVTLDVRMERSPALALLKKFGFSHVHTHEAAGRTILDFYLDLYTEPEA